MVLEVIFCGDERSNQMPECELAMWRVRLALCEPDSDCEVEVATATAYLRRKKQSKQRLPSVTGKFRLGDERKQKPAM